MTNKIKVYIWGTGQKAREYLSKSEIKDEQILGFVQSAKTMDTFYGKKVFAPEEIVLREYEYILVCVMCATRNIYNLCIQMLSLIHI